jgi:hypothetical protein
MRHQQRENGMAKSKRSSMMKTKAKAMAKRNLAKAKVKLGKLKARAKVELARHSRAFKLAARCYRLALKSS